MTAPRPDDDLPRDAHLLAALRHAPDADEGVDPALRERILSRARGLAPPGRPAPAAATWWSRWARALRPGTPWGAAFASLVLGTVIVMVWRDGTPPAVVEPDAPAVRRERAEILPSVSAASAVAPATPDRDAAARDIVAREVAASKEPSREATIRDAAARDAAARAEAEAVDAAREARQAQAAKAAKAAAEVLAPRTAPPELAEAPVVKAAGIAPPPPVADASVTATPAPAASPAPAAAPAPAATTATAVAAAKAPAASSEAGPPARPAAVARAQVAPPPASAAALPRTAREALGSALSLAPAPASARAPVATPAAPARPGGGADLATARADAAPGPLDGWHDGDSPWIPRLRALDTGAWALRPSALPPAGAVTVAASDGRRGRLWLEPGEDGGARLRWQPAAGAPVWEQALSAPALDPWLAAGLRPPG